MRPYLLIYILPVVSAAIDFELSGSFHTNIAVQSSGSDKAIVTDSERIAFNITDGIIKNCVREYLGGKPSDVYIHGPTPWGNLYKIYGWTETYRILRPISSRVINVASSPQMLKQQIIETNGNIEIGISQTIYNRFSTLWIAAPELTVEKINYHISLDNFVMFYESALGENGVKLKAMTTGVSLSNLTDFETLGSVIVELYATRVSVKAEVVYQASLWGNAVLNYERAFRGHHFYSPNLEDIMLNCGLSNSLLVKEVIDVRFYTDAKIVVKNKISGLVVLTRNVDIYPL